MRITVGLMISLFVLSLPAAAQDCGGCATKAPGEARPCHYLEVQGLVPDGPSAAAGVLVGDILLEYGKRTVGCLSDLNVARSLAVGESIPVSFGRGDKALNFILPKGKLGIYFKEWQNDLALDSGTRLISTVPNLSWDQMNSFMGAMQAIGRRMGDFVGYPYLCGVSGAAFRTHFFDTWCPSSPDPTCGYDAGAVALKARGLVANWLHVSSDGKNKPLVVDAVRRSIDEGMPVLAIDLIEAPEWGVIIGYQKNGEELLCRTYFDKRKRFEIAQKFPFAVAILRREGRVPDDSVNITEGFGIVVENLTTPKYGEYFSGLAAFDKWVARLRGDKFTKLDSAKLSNVVQANYWTFSRLVADRKTGIEYLNNVVAKRLPGLAARAGDLAALYQREVETLEPLLDGMPCPGSVVPGWQWAKADREKEIAALVKARAFEKQTLPIWKELAGKK